MKRGVIQRSSVVPARCCTLTTMNSAGRLGAAVRSVGVAPLSFFGEPTGEASVIGWMPAAAVYFRDPDGHQLEYLAMLDERPRPDLGITTWTGWLEKPRP